MDGKTHKVFFFFFKTQDKQNANFNLEEEKPES